MNGELEKDLRNNDIATRTLVSIVREHNSSHGAQVHKELPKLTCKPRANSANSIQNGVEESSRRGILSVRIPGIQTRLCRVINPVTRVEMPRGTKSKLARALRNYKTMTSVARPVKCTKENLSNTYTSGCMTYYISRCGKRLQSLFTLDA